MQSKYGVKQQKSAVRLISFSNFQAATTPILKDVCIHQTPNIVFHLNITHKSLNIECPSAIQEILGLQYIQNPFSKRSACLKLFVILDHLCKNGNLRIQIHKNRTVIQWKSYKFVTKMLTCLILVLL